MAKFKDDKNLVLGYKKQQAFEQDQERLKEKNKIEEEHVVVVEKSNMAKFTVKTIGLILRILATIFIFALAAVGAICLIYPSTRMVFFSIFNGTISQLQDLLGI